MKRGYLICFIGIDGSGKTTQAKALAEAMNEKGIKCKYVYNQFHPVMSKPFISIAKAIFLRKKDVFSTHSDYSNTIRKFFKNRVLSTISKYLVLSDYFFQVLFRVYIPLSLNMNIICDRCIHDVVVGIAVDLNYSDDKIVGLLENVLPFFPKPDLTVLIDVPEEIAYGRKDDVPSVDFLRKRRKIYLKIRRKFNMVILDGSKELTELEHIAQDEVFKKGVC